MTGILSTQIKEKYLKNFHFWAITIIALFLVFIYQAWPWTVWELRHGIWQWFPWISSLYTLALVEFMNRIIGILFFIPLFYATLCFSWRGALAITILALGAVLPILTYIWSLRSFITNLVILLLPLTVILVITLVIEWRRREKKIFAEREEDQRKYISKILDAQESERQRIAQELHDDTIQTLLVIANNTQNLINSVDGDTREVKRKAESIKQMTLEAVEDTRRISLNLRPSIIDNLGLTPALRWLADRMCYEYNIQTKIIIQGTERDLSSQAKVNIFRVVQEALNNVRRHSQANEVVIILEFSTEHLKIKLQDDGKGFVMPEKIDKLSVTGKLGLIGIQQRINLLGGSFKIYSKPGNGTLLLIEAKV